VEEALENVQDALRAVIELYEDLGKKLPFNVQQISDRCSYGFLGR